ncbi:peptidoglycan/xylan/chitin deacetylase (PgdA/CDA1 family) [Actinokineospora baliensis]|uniref:polysaccharide deacetylase family protein n=1 Tax=Actinokineospora baliensis TaxID=547056 RepID=UPI0019589715|nr:polysaccharide deacetylase family protein [Actinokineospora baliensis]MBM7773861.1 peptidoglycan/xylan/chitin deacetylase (PgdA/CDA1 family) [Actinokineospora baliensis]
MLKRLVLTTAALLLAVATPAAAAPTSEIVYTTRTSGQVLALTFDDGPSPEWTPRVLDLLRETKTRAVFCLVGSEVVKYPDLVKRIVADGHPVCNHTYGHENLATLTPEQVRANLVATNAAIRQAAGNPTLPIPYFRAPFGIFAAPITDIAASLSHTSLAWTVDPQDWDGSPAPVLVQRLTAQAYPTAILLSHDGGGDRSATVAAYQDLIPRWKTAGYTFDLPATTGGSPTPCTAPTWNRNTTYLVGTRVTQDGKLYQANWWTRLERPSAAPWTWTPLGPC